MSVINISKGFRLALVDEQPRILEDRAAALDEFREAVSSGVWCEVWDIDSDTIIAKFPGMT